MNTDIDARTLALRLFQCFAITCVSGCFQGDDIGRGPVGVADSGTDTAIDTSDEDSSTSDASGTEDTTDTTDAETSDGLPRGPEDCAAAFFDETNFNNSCFQ